MGRGRRGRRNESPKKVREFLKTEAERIGVDDVFPPVDVLSCGQIG